ncbi:hypothetical protein WA026_010519 [Henosepilachna vigintioctopunctata]|uniref:Uncharacterized protein n=1 Tax=Henosepilachna vigintioctopunctata TaxID=420089 RepID=A0AAW1VA13_9CUCU
MLKKLQHDELRHIGHCLYSPNNRRFVNSAGQLHGIYNLKCHVGLNNKPQHISELVPQRTDHGCKLPARKNRHSTKPTQDSNAGEYPIATRLIQLLFIVPTPVPFARILTNIPSSSL